MKATREREFDGVVIQAETPQDNEVLCYLWCNKARAVAFERKDGLVALTVGTAYPDMFAPKQE